MKAEAGRQASLVIHFNSGKAFLEAENKAELRRFFQKYEVKPESRIFIVGYTDAVGDKQHNYKLSRKRAQAIRRAIISAFGFDAAVVMALGKGEENPVADNRHASGRASNRRVEIYLANTELRKPERIYGPGDPYLNQIQDFVREAQTLIKQRRLSEAVQILKKARGLGGDHYSDWHATYAIAGFYAQASTVEMRAHLVTALKMDPYNFIAREYLSRIIARERVARGEITHEMGLTADSAIGVTAVAQQYEYLRLFQVEPLAHRELEGRPVDVWECVTAQGAPVVYFFDYSRIYDWAFSKGTAARLPEGDNIKKTVSKEEREVSMVSKVAVPPSAPLSDNPKKVWESRVFK
ncbi:MAG: OmpA family protein [Desulfobacteraceae bacterium]